MEHFDLIVIGGGRASTLAIKAGKQGQKVALIEKSSLGGTCPNRGCVPSKLLIGHAHVARTIKESDRHFISSSIQDINIQKIFDDTNLYISKVSPRYDDRLKDIVQVFKGEGFFTADKIIEINGQLITADKIVIATGTRPNNPLHEKAWTSDDIFPLKGKTPKSISVVGSGFIACELANFFDAIGIETTLLVRGKKLLGREDGEISKIFTKEFSKNVKVHFETNIKTIDYKEDGFVLELETKAGEKTTHKSEKLLYATGRKSNADTLKLENTSIELDERNFIKRDDFFETSVKGVYVVGDASGQYMLQHAASIEVKHLGEFLLDGKKESLKLKYMPHAVFSDPEVASVGLSEEDAKKMKINYVSATSSWDSSVKAMSTRLDYPRTKFIIDPKSYEILGCHIIGPESSVLLHQVLTVMHIDNDIRHLTDMLYVHPALNEAILDAAEKVLEAILEK